MGEINRSLPHPEICELVDQVSVPDNHPEIDDHTSTRWNPEVSNLDKFRKNHARADLAKIGRGLNNRIPAQINHIKGQRVGEN